MFAAEDSLRVKHMAEVEKMCDLYDLDQLRGLNDRLGGAGAALRELFLTELESFNARLREERAKVAEISRGPGGTSEGKAASHAKVGDGTVPSVQNKSSMRYGTIRGINCIYYIRCVKCYLFVVVHWIERHILRVQTVRTVCT